jgi:hypothetical protein
MTKESSSEVLSSSDSVSETITGLMLRAIVNAEENAYAAASLKKREILVQKD